MELESCGEYVGINREPASSPQLTAAVLLFLKSWRIAAFPPFIAAVSIYRATPRHTLKAPFSSGGRKNIRW